jgi:hypothetical protein
MPILYEGTEIIFASQQAFDRYQDAVAEAKRIGEEKGIQMTVVALAPVHFGWTKYRLPVGDTFINLKENVVFYPVGIFSNDPNFVALGWWEGAKTEYLYDWLTKFVYYTEEKEATMTPQPVFKTAFTFTVETEEPATDVDAWIIGYVVLPTTMKGMSIKR